MPTNRRRILVETARGLTRVLERVNGHGGKIHENGFVDVWKNTEPDFAKLVDIFRRNREEIFSLAIGGDAEAREVIRVIPDLPRRMKFEGLKTLLDRVSTLV